MMEEFKTNVDLSITGCDKAKPGSGTVTITWKLELDMRNFGVKGILLYAPDQTVKALITRYDEETDEESETEEMIELKDIKINGYIDNYSKVEAFLSSGIFPKELEIWKNTLIQRNGYPMPVKPV
jgi:hypothetical protein